MRKIGFLVTLLSVCLVSTSFAHIAEYTDQTMAYGDAVIEVTHSDADQAYEDQKGQWILQITNTGEIAWTDFHFGISFGDAIFENPGGYPIMVDGEGLANPTDVLSADGKTWDLYFADDTVTTGEQVTFTLYTNNQASGGLFGVCFWPTAVPEPATLTMLGLGALGLLRRKKINS